MKIFPLTIVLLLFLHSACYKAPSSNSSSQNSAAIASTPEATTTTSKPDIPAGDYAKSLDSYNAKKYDEAVMGFQAVVKSEPKNLNAHYYLGKSYEGLKKEDDAVNSYKEAIKIKPDHADSNFSAGNIYYIRKNYDDALPFLEQAAKTDFKSPKTLMLLGENQRMLKIYNKAIVQYQKVIGFEPENADAYYGLGLTYMGLKNKIAAGQQLRKLEPLNKELAKKLSDQIGS